MVQGALHAFIALWRDDAEKLRSNPSKEKDL